MNAPDRYERFVVPEGIKKVSYERDTKIINAASFTVEREDHTVDNIVRMQLHRDENVLFAGYKLPHPLQYKIIVRVKRIRETLYSALLLQDISFFDNETVGDLTSRLGSDCQQVSRVIGNDLNMILRNALQQPLRLNPAEVCEVIAAVSSETASTNANAMAVSSRLSNNPGKPSIDVAVSVLIKLVIDMYVLDSGTAAPLTLSMLEEMLSSPKATCRVRAFDLVLNLGVHAHLLEPMVTDDPSTIEEEYSHDSSFDKEDQHGQGKKKSRF